MLADRYGLALSTASPAARDAYVEGCDLVLTLYPGAVAAFDRAIAADPGFALAHAARARALQMGGDVAGAKAAMAKAEALAGGGPGRDAGHVGVFSLLIGGKPVDALAAVRRHVETWARDALVVSLAANQTGLIGTSGRAGREQDQLDFLAALAPHYGDDGWFDSHYAMALSELGHRAEAWPRIERSIADQPRNAYVAHARAHYHYEGGETEDARTFLHAWLAGYPREGTLHGHLSWHLALAHLEQGDVEAGIRACCAALEPDDHPGPALVKLLDGPSFLWRAELAGHPRDDARWRSLRAFAYRSFPHPGMPFADWHIALIDAVIGDTTSAAAREREMREMVDSGRYPAGATVLAAARGFAAFERLDFATAIDAILSMFPERERICGSRAQIDLVEFTLLKAYLASGRVDEARRLVEERRPGPGIPLAGAAAVRMH